MDRSLSADIPLVVIQEAIRGDSEALAVVCDYYSEYIRYLSIRQKEDVSGRKNLCVDEDMCLQLKAKLLNSIVSNFRVLSD